MTRIGIFGGTFDPPHKGHIAIAEQARKQLCLDKIYFVPAYIPPHKLKIHLGQKHSSMTAIHRLKMVKLAIKGRKEFKVSTIELKRKGISYTVDTIKNFKRQFPNAELVMIIGADNLAQFQSWKSPETILALASLAVYKRKGFNKYLKNPPITFEQIKGRILQVSSTEIRNRIRKGMSIESLVPECVANYIEQYSLYMEE